MNLRGLGHKVALSCLHTWWQLLLTACANTLARLVHGTGGCKPHASHKGTRILHVTVARWQCLGSAYECIFLLQCNCAERSRGPHMPRACTLATL
jgi:hypothetical protein